MAKLNDEINNFHRVTVENDLNLIFKKIKILPRGDQSFVVAII